MATPTEKTSNSSCVIETQRKNSWIQDIENDLINLNIDAESAHFKKTSIYQVSNFTRDFKSEVFIPQVVSLGPYHHGSGQLVPMEVHKRRALLHFIKRSNKPLQAFLDVLDDDLINTLQEQYDRLEEEWWKVRKEEFRQLMLTDGCFILEVLECDEDLKYGCESLSYADDDPFFSKKGMLRSKPYIRRDMLLLENQLPLPLLHKLANLFKPNYIYWEVNMKIIRFLGGGRLKTMEQGLHTLDLYRKNMLGWSGWTMGKATTTGRSGVPVLSAMALRDAGVLISHQKNKEGNLLDITFKRGVLCLPKITVDESTEYVYLNMVAFEHLHLSASNEVSAYVSFMDDIINSDKDVSLLVRRGIMKNSLGSEESVEKLFKTLSKEITLGQDVYGEVRCQLSIHCDVRYNKLMAELKNEYFEKAMFLALISLFMTLFSNVLAIVQTLYTLKEYYKKHG